VKEADIQHGCVIVTYKFKFPILARNWLLQTVR